MKIVSLNIGWPQVLVKQARQYSSAINRKPVDGAVQLSLTGFEGDQVSNQSVHGGPEKAACVFPREHYSFFEERLGREMEIPAFGENLTTEGLLEDQVCVGDTFRVGRTVVQVSGPRQPCAKPALKHRTSDITRWIVESGFSGFYLRVREEGEIRAGDTFELVERLHIDATIACMQRERYAKQPDAALLEKWIGLAELMPSYREVLERRRSGSSGFAE